jgi:plasmid stabilization system protein ParE
MAKRIIIWTETAANQRRFVFEYWNLRNGNSKYSKKLLRLVNRRLNLISNNPNLFKPTNFAFTREAAMGNYSIYYKSINEQIIVSAFWDNRQDPDKLLEILKK